MCAAQIMVLDETMVYNVARRQAEIVIEILLYLVISCVSQPFCLAAPPPHLWFS